MIPAHLAIIPDGNRRFARQHGWSVDEGYAAAARKGLEAVEWCLDAGIPRLSIFTSSTENVARRPRREVIGFFQGVRSLCDGLRERPEVAVHVVGDMGALPDFVPGREALLRLAAPPGGRARLVIHLAANYSAEGDLAGGTNGGAAPRRRWSAAVPRIELVMRTGGQQRLSGFLPLQCAYAELWFTETLWPAFTRPEFDAALAWYGRQEQHFGE
jgi:short-chain Z-isoprenyl diphosphate synthase